MAGEQQDATVGPFPHGGPPLQIGHDPLGEARRGERLGGTRPEGGDVPQQAGEPAGALVLVRHPAEDEAGADEDRAEQFAEHLDQDDGRLVVDQVVMSPQGRWDPFAMLESAVAADLRRALALQPGRTGKSPLASAFEDPPFPARKWLVLVDAVDEVHDAQLRDLLEDALTKYASTPHLTLVVTSRDWFWSRGIEQVWLESLRLCRLNLDVHRSLVSKYLTAFGLSGEDVVTAFLAELEARRLTGLAMQPMFCVALCRVFAEDGGRALPAGRGGAVRRAHRDHAGRRGPAGVRGRRQAGPPARVAGDPRRRARPAPSGAADAGRPDRQNVGPGTHDAFPGAVE
ncbi:hypothetical protein [Streptomyces cyaneus]|uniref:hypothetical protein n=1 Tax=Streptomyces cyaneus TaxID=1904 RepID=UPI000FF879DA